APSPASSPAEKWPNDEKAETRARGLITKKPRIVVRGSPAFLTDRTRGKWAAGCLPNAAGVSWFLSSKGCGRGRATGAAMRWRTPVTIRGRTIFGPELCERHLLSTSYYARDQCADVETRAHA